MRFNEGLRKVGSYLVAVDVLRKYQEAEDRIKIEKTGQADILPLEAGLVTGAKIYLLRLRNSATLMSRWTGIDLAIRGSKRLLRR